MFQPASPQPKPLNRRQIAQDVEDENEEVDEEDDAAGDLSSAGGVESDDDVTAQPEQDVSTSRRKRKHHEEELEDLYMQRLAREDAKEAEAVATERAAKRQKATLDGNDAEVKGNGSSGAESDTDDEVETGMIDNDIEDHDDIATSPPPQHESLTAGSTELDKANCTVFLANVSTTAITSKSARKTLTNHLKSFFPETSKPTTSKSKSKTMTTASQPRLESLRFRSTPYTPTLPKRAAYTTAQSSLMPTTTPSTNAYAVYSTPALARSAVAALNATMILDRHLRADLVAHPAPTVPRRCVFVGNLGFVDDESAIRAANEAEGRETRKPAKQPADVEEGLWRVFGKVGEVESVRVPRDAQTRVGKGFAYVQFKEEVAVEGALGLDGKTFAPMLPRRLRVQRAKTIKRKDAKGGVNGGKREAGAKGTGYRRKVTGQEASQAGRARKLFGRAGGERMKRSRGGGGDGATGANVEALGKKGEAGGMKRPEDFVFEGHRAKSAGGKAGLKLGGRKKKGGKVTGRSKAFRAGGKGSSK